MKIRERYIQNSIESREGEIKKYSCEWCHFEFKCFVKQRSAEKHSHKGWASKVKCPNCDMFLKT